MNAKEATFQALDTFADGANFKGIRLMGVARYYHDASHYPSTYLRYMREYRQTHDCRITCINKRKSLYRMER